MASTPEEPGSPFEPRWSAGSGPTPRASGVYRLRRVLLDRAGARLGEASGEAELAWREGRLWQSESGRVVLGEWSSSFTQVLTWELGADGHPVSLTCGGLAIPLEGARQGWSGCSLCANDRYRVVVRPRSDGWLLAFIVVGPAKSYRSVTRYRSVSLPLRCPAGGGAPLRVGGS